MRCFLIFTVFISTIFQSFSQSKVFEVGFLLDKSTPEIESILNELENEIRVVVGEDATVHFSEKNRLTNEFNVALALKNYKQFLASDVDIIIAFGVVNNLIISQQTLFPKPTILFGVLSKELAEKQNFETEIKNLTSIISIRSFQEDLEILKQIANPKSIGIVVEKSFIEHIALKSIFETIGNQLGVSTKIIPFESINDIKNNLSDIESVYLVGGFYLTDAEIKELAMTFIDKKLSSFSAISLQHVESGILGTQQGKSNIDQYFRRIALTVESIVNADERLSSTTIQSSQNLTLNYNTISQLGLPLKYSLIPNANFIGKAEEKINSKKYSLVDVMQETVANNLQLRTVALDINLSEKEFQLAKSDYLPNINSGISGNYVDPDLAIVSNGQNPEITTNGQISIGQTIFSEAANANISIQKALFEAQKEDYKSESLNTIYNAATAYFTALILKTNLTIQNKNLELTKYNLKIATENFEAGQAGKSDVLRFKSQMAQNTQQMIEAINQLEQSYFALNQALNNPINTKIDVEEAELSTGVFKSYNYKKLAVFLDDPQLRNSFVNFLVSQALVNAPELKALDYNLKATERSERLFGIGRFLPTVALQGLYNYQFSRSGEGVNFPAGFPVVPEGYYTVGLNVSLPIFNQNKQNINKQIAAIQKDQLSVTKDNIMLSIEKNVNDAVLNMINEISNIELSKVFEQTAKEALDLTQTAYASGAVNIVQLLDAQNNYLQAQQASANANYNYLLNAMQLERFLGKFFLFQSNEQQDDFFNKFLEYNQSNKN